MLKRVRCDYWKLSDWEALDLYAQRHLLSANESCAIEEEIKGRAQVKEWIFDEAHRRR